MKQIFASVLLGLILTGCLTNGDMNVRDKALTPEEVRAEIARLRKIIVPPDGTHRDDVGAVYGVPRVAVYRRGVTRGSPKMYPLHSYHLLPPGPRQEFRAFMHVTYRDNKITIADINHMCVVKNRLFLLPGRTSEQQRMQHKLEIERENVRVLTDLREIKAKFDDKLKVASWNK